MYKVIGYDSFSREEFNVGEFSTKDEAVSVAKDKGGVMMLMYVYDAIGNRVARYGEY